MSDKLIAAGGMAILGSALSAYFVYSGSPLLGALVFAGAVAVSLDVWSD